MFRSLCVESACRALRSAMGWSAVGLALFCSACAAPQAPSGVAGPQPPPATATYVGTWKLQVEADGLPAQHAPRERSNAPDDPSEPWSPNYGSVPVRAEPLPTALPPPPQKLQHAARKSAHVPAADAHRIASIDAEDIIRRAVAAHEMRRRD